MKKLIWKIRFAFLFRRKTGMPWAYCWQCAEANLEMINDDISVPPLGLVEDEIEAGLNN